MALSSIFHLNHGNILMFTNTYDNTEVVIKTMSMDNSYSNWYCRVIYGSLNGYVRMTETRMDGASHSFYKIPHRLLMKDARELTDKERVLYGK
jgi:hypothetical protein